MKRLFNNPYFNAIRNINILLETDQKRNGLLMMGLLILNALFDIVGMASIVPLIDAAVNPNTITEKWYLLYPYKWLGIQDYILFLFVISCIILALFIIKNLVSIWILYIQSKFAFNVSKRLNLKMFQYYFKRGYGYIQSRESGKKIYDTLWLPYYFGNSYLLETLILTTELFVLFMIFLALLFYQPIVVLLLIIVIVPVFFLIYGLTKNKTKQLGIERNKLFPSASTLVLDSYNGYNDVVLFNKEDHFLNIFNDLVTKIKHVDSKQNGIYAKIHQRLNDIVLVLGLVTVFGCALIFRENSTDILAMLGIFGIAAYRFLPSVNRIMSSFLTLKNFSYVVDELQVIKNTNIEFYGQVEKMNFDHSIEVQNLSFQFPEAESKVLNNINMKIRKGDIVGLIGPSGSGKTTFLNLFLRFLHETEGQILIDGVKIDGTNTREFQKTLGYVQQNVYIRNGSLIENIAFGENENEVDLTRIEWVLKHSMLNDFVQSHPRGLSMELGENGVKLSGGQKQRIGIARALYKDAKIILLDEITSALDPETEKNIISTINHLADLGKTIIIIAHRISTLERCNHIYELRNGSIIAEHSYQSLKLKSSLS